MKKTQLKQIRKKYYTYIFLIFTTLISGNELQYEQKKKDLRRGVVGAHQAGKMLQNHL